MNKEQKWCYAVIGEKSKCVMDYKSKKRQDFEKQFCKHLSKGKEKETCEFYLLLKKYR